MKLKIHTLKALKNNFIYILENEECCAVIDPGDAAPVKNFLKRSGLRLTHVLLTHHHPDHTYGASELKGAENCEVWCSAYDRRRLEAATKTAQGTMSLWQQPIEILDIPGHTQGQIGYYFPDTQAFFGGDTLFSGGCGRLLEGSFEQMFDSLQKTATLPGDTLVYFGHEYTLRNLDFVLKNAAAPRQKVEAYLLLCRQKLAQGLPTTPSTIGTELEINPFLRAQSVLEFKKWRELRDQF